MTIEQNSHRNARHTLIRVSAVLGAMLISPPVTAQNKILSTFTFLDVPIKEFQNKKFLGSVTNDRFDVSKEFDLSPKNTPDEMKVSGLIALNPSTLLVLERTDLVAKLYSVDLGKATNILKTKWDDPKTAPSLEVLDDPAKAELCALAKTLVIDLTSLNGMPEKIEGIALLDQYTIAVANDNDFDSEESQYDAEGNNVGKGKKSQILIIGLDKPLPVPLKSVSAR